MTELGIAGGPRRPETRNYTSLVTDALLAAASGSSPGAGSSSSPVACASWWARGLAAAVVRPPALADVLTPAALWETGEGLALDGEIVFRLAGPRLARAYEWDVTGRPDPASWSYQLTEAGPSITETRTVPAGQVLHVRIFPDPFRPWSGRSPLAMAKETRRLAGGLEQALADEAENAARAQVVTVPEGAQNLAAVITAVKAARGKLTMPETFAGGEGDRGGAPLRDWSPVRMGPVPPAEAVSLREQVQGSAAALYGLDPILIDAAGDGTAKREAWRRLQVGVLEPLARIIGVEVAAKLGVEAAFDFAPLAATDLAARARAVHVLQQAGVKVDDARAIAGL